MSDFDTGDVVRLGCVLKFNSLFDIVNVLHVKIVSGGGLAFAAFTLDVQEYCDALYANISGRLSDLVTDDRISIKNVTQSTVWGAIAWDAFAGGINAGEPTALQTACLAWGRTSISRVQIRKYLGPFTEADLADALWNSTARAAAQNYIDYHIVENLMGEGSVLQGVAYSPSLARATVALTGATSEVPVTQRRRRQGRGS